ncbi:hypothetical protein B0H13DRAFT_2226237 [Mycena leptocephala]|nr:hypothetical protein B0H13DRAFT_2226237 [Mycena leptocephala]
MAPVAPLATSSASLSRPLTSILPPTDSTPSFLISSANKSYKHQYANIYFVRLRILRDVVEEKARQRWHASRVSNPILVPKVLEVVKSQLCYIVGTVYMDMPLKPNVMEDMHEILIHVVLRHQNSIPPPPPLAKFYSPDDNIMLEDESGRIQLVGERVVGARLTPTGEFEVVDICYAEMAPQPGHEGRRERWKSTKDAWIALVSGLDIGSASPADAQIQMLLRGPQEQISAAQISRLIMLETRWPQYDDHESESLDEGRKGRSLSAHLLDMARTMPIHLLPGKPTLLELFFPTTLPARNVWSRLSYGSFSCETNPTYLRIASGSESETTSEVTRTLLVNSGQPLNDMFKYVASPPNTPLSLHMAPTAPDTLWCHPYFSADPFLISETPDLYIVGGQQRFGTKMQGAEKCRVVLVPRFADTGILVW